MTKLNVRSGFYTSSDGPGGFHITVNDPASTSARRTNAGTINVIVRRWV